MARYLFSGKNILVTGASGGLGSAIAKNLAAAGAHLVVTSRSVKALKELISTLPDDTHAIPFAADLSKTGEAQMLAKRATEALGHIDVLFNNAGVGYFALMEEATEENIRYLFQVNTFSPMALIKALLPQMKARGTGRVINFVLMQMNFHQVEEIIRLAARLGGGQVNFKQYDVLRGECGKGYGLFAPKETKEVRRLEKSLSKVRRLGRRLQVHTTAFSFIADEQPVCDQDPRDSLFIRHDGFVAPCIRLAMGGPSTFLGEEVTMPTVHYGRLPEQNLPDLWLTDRCVFYRERFRHRVHAHDAEIEGISSETSWTKYQKTMQTAKEAMPEPPEGCRMCHYLYDI